MHRIAIIAFFLFLFSCVQDPLQLQENNIDLGQPPFALIVNEGLFGYNNATLTLFSIPTGKLNNNIFYEKNGFELGDIANDAITIDTTIFVLVSTSRILYEISTKSFKVTRLLKFPEGSYPRQIINYNQILLVSDAYLNSVYIIDKNEFKIKQSINVGAQPEGLAILDNKLYVVNSGWGDLNAENPEASTIYEIDLNNYEIINKIKTFSNPVEIFADTLNKKIYLTYYNYPSKIDSIGGIVEYDKNLQILRHWKGNFLKTKKFESLPYLISILDNNPANGKNNRPGLALIDLITNSVSTILENKIKGEFWYNFEIEESTNRLWICNARDFQSRGKIHIYDFSYNFQKISLVKELTVGINPNKIIFLN